MPSKKSEAAAPKADEAEFEAAWADALAAEAAEAASETHDAVDEAAPEATDAEPTPAEVLLAELEAQGVPRSSIVLITDDLTGRLARVELA